MKLSEQSSTVQEFLAELSAASGPVTGLAVVVVTNESYHSFQFNMATEDLAKAAKLLKIFANGPTAALH